MVLEIENDMVTPSPARPPAEIIRNMVFLFSDWERDPNLKAAAFCSYLLRWQNSEILNPFPTDEEKYPHYVQPLYHRNNKTDADYIKTLFYGCRSHQSTVQPGRRDDAQTLLPLEESTKMSRLSRRNFFLGREVPFTLHYADQISSAYWEITCLH